MSATPASTAQPVGNRGAKRLTPLQRALLAHMAELGGVHIHIGRATKATGHLRGYTWEGVHLSLQSLLKAGLIQTSGQNNGFYTLAEKPTLTS